jgi:N-acylneuraminate cytidylyltransferase
MKLAVIPARGGSKRIPRKNVKEFAGKPMIAWSISAAQASGLFDHIVVSTDDQEVAEIARALGAEVPFMRPGALADDHTPTVPVIAHAITWVSQNWGSPDTACCIYATAPFIRVDDLKLGAKLLLETGADYAFPVTSFPFPIQRAVHLTENGRMQMFSPEHALTRSQDLIEGFHDVGQFYWGRTEAWLSGRTIMGLGAAPVIIPRHRAQDIDTPEDWTRAEMMFRLLGEMEHQ